MCAPEAEETEIISYVSELRTVACETMSSFRQHIPFQIMQERTSHPSHAFKRSFTCQSYHSLNSFYAHLMAPIQFSTGLNRVPYLVNRATCLPRLHCALLTNVGHVTSRAPHGHSPACLSPPHCFPFSLSTHVQIFWAPQKVGPTWLGEVGFSQVS